MQYPLLWLDIGAYKGAQLSALMVGGDLKTLMVDATSDGDAEMCRALSAVGFVKNSKGRPNLWYKNGNIETTCVQLKEKLAQSVEVPFNPADHVMRVEVSGKDEVKAKPATPTTEPAADRIRRVIADTGDVRGFAIKDLRGKGDALLRSARQMTTEQQKAYLTKSAIWPSPDYNAMYEAGVEPGTAQLIKMLRDSLCARPGQLGSRKYLRRPPRPDVYAELVGYARDAMASVKTLDEAVEAIYQFACRYGVQEETTLRDGTSYTSTKYRSPLSHDSEGNPINTSLNGVVKNKAFWLVGMNDAKPEYENRSRNKFRTLARLGTSDNTTWNFLPRNHKLRGAGGKRLSKAEKARRKEEMKDKPPTRISRTDSEKAKRQGLPEWRQNNTDADPHDLIEAFDLSGVEFGNWESQAERQWLLNQALDALNDLSHILGVDSRVIGLGGRLGIAFGSRGRGGKNAAAAHYEPANVAINLTKRGGAGSLAHEWAHALDNTSTTRRLYGKEAPMATDIANGGTTTGGPDFGHLTLGDKTAKNLHAVMRVIMYDAELTRETFRRDLELRTWQMFGEVGRPYISGAAFAQQPGTLTEKLHARVESIIERVAKDLAARGIEPEKAEDIARISAEKTHIWGDYDLDTWLQLNQLSKYGHEATAMNRIRYEVRGAVRHAGVLAALQGTLGDFKGLGVDDEMRRSIQERLDAREKGSLECGVPAPSPMLTEARLMDRSRSKPYWSRRDEMFARSFEVYVKHKIEAAGGRNDFLVSFQKPSTSNGATFNSVYPNGPQLERVVAAFDKLFAEISQEERESLSPVREGRNGVLMYSLDGDRIRAGVPDAIQADLLRLELQSLVGDGISVTLQPTLGDVEGAVVAGSYDSEQALIRLAMDNQDVLGAGYHEAYHGALDVLMTDTERAIVTSSFQPGGRYRKALEAALEREGKDHLLSEIEQHPEEAQAYGFQYWMAGKLELEPETPVGRIFKKVKDLIESVQNAVRGYGFTRSEEVFEALASGQMAAREDDRQGQESPTSTVHRKPAQQAIGA